jgi:hypothetical protein
MKEFYPGNSFYGHANIIKKYAGFPNWLSLPVCIQHGWMMNTIPQDARRDAVENWYWSKGIAEKFYERYKFIKYRIVGSPFLYCLKNINFYKNEEKIKKGTIVFPFHSTDKIKLHADNEKYCYMLNELSDEYKPITICIYYHDKKNGVDSIFLKHNFEVVCNGTDPCSDNFLYNFIKNVYLKKYLFTNEWSSPMHYASIMGCKVHLYGPEVSVVKSDDSNFSSSFRDHFNFFDKENRKYYSFPDGDKGKQYNIAYEELGMRYMLSSMTIRLLLWRLIFTPQYFSSFFI